MKKTVLNKEAKEILPSLFLVTLHAGDKKAATLYTNYVVAYIPEDAIEMVTQILQEKDTNIYNEGLQLGGWIYRSHHTIPVQRLEEMFNEVGTKTKQTKELQRKRVKNDLMQAIIDNKDVGLLHENIQLFSEAEQSFIHDKITTA